MDQRVGGVRRAVREQPLVGRARRPRCAGRAGGTSPRSAHRIGDSAPGTSAGSIAWRPARNRPRSPTSTCRAPANSSSRRMRRRDGLPGHPSHHEPGRAEERAVVVGEHVRNPQPGPSARAHRVRFTAHDAGAPGRPGGSRRRMSSSPSAVNAHVSREAPPGEALRARRSRPARRTRARARRRAPQMPALDSDGEVIDDLVEVLGQTRALAVAARPAGHAFGEAGRPCRRDGCATGCWTRPRRASS